MTEQIKKGLGGSIFSELKGLAIIVGGSFLLMNGISCAATVPKVISAANTRNPYEAIRELKQERQVELQNKSRIVRNYIYPVFFGVGENVAYKIEPVLGG